MPVANKPTNVGGGYQLNRLIRPPIYFCQKALGISIVVEKIQFLESGVEQNMQHPTQVINVDNKFLGHYYWRVVIIRISCHHIYYIFQHSDPPLSRKITTNTQCNVLPYIYILNHDGHVPVTLRT